MLSPATENGLYTTKVGICFRNSRKRFCMYWCTYNLISPHANIILWAAQWKGHQPCPGSSSRSNIQAQLCRAWCIPWPYLTCTGQFPFFVFFFSFLPWKTLLTCTTRKSLKGKLPQIPKPELWNLQNLRVRFLYVSILYSSI